MKVAIVEDFSKVDDPVKTEEIISEQLIRKAESIDSDYVYVSFPLAWNINKKTASATPKIVLIQYVET